MSRSFAKLITLSGVLAACCHTSHPATAQRGVFPVAAPQIEERPIGPYNVHALQGGSELVRPIPAASHVVQPLGLYTLSLWVHISAEVPPSTLIAGVGRLAAEDSRYLGLRDGKPFLRLGHGREIDSIRVINSGWHMLAASSDGTLTTLYVDGKAQGHGADAGSTLSPELVIAPLDPKHALLAESLTHFGGEVAQVLLVPESTTAEGLSRAAAQPPDVALLRFDEASPAWPVQTRGQAGYTAQQDPSLLPSSKAPFGKAVAKPLPPPAPSALTHVGADRWTVAANWMLIAAPGVSASPTALSIPGADTRKWMRATVPGTVLTTMVDRGIYPDPDYGLNNMAIPESLAHQDYWYRVEFDTPAVTGKRFLLGFEGINYAAEVWLNGQQLGKIKGAFIRGDFDATGLLKPAGRNALAVRISPPPHPGIPQEQSLKGGPGENGGAMILDGPTFMATEGWDWIPAIRDRNSGIWQPVTLRAVDAVRLGDVQVITRLPLPDTSTADVEINVPVRNNSASAVSTTVHARFEGVDVSRTVSVPPGDTTVHLTPAEFPQLHVTTPRLWWPNGYGRPDLYHLMLSLETGGAASDRAETTFGMREITYELSLFDSAGRLRRVEVSPTEARALQQQVVDVRHEGMRLRETPFSASSLTLVGETSPAVKTLSNQAGLTDLVLKVNGIRIAARGGNWGMDDSRKRVSREKLEPYFRLHREANVNIIRNWVGQDTEETFFQLADEYGMLVWNDFWESTQDYNVEAQDVALFLDNARDVVRRFRNHPSIAIWCGRNEGVPQPILNEGLIDLLNTEDGTRYYTPGSNRINLRNSGPYKYQDPALFYTTLDKGFSVELGISSFSTLESFQAWTAPADQWPISDTWAYHDWHWSGNGDVHPFLDALAKQFGAATDLKDFERKAQMINYVDHRAIFEGFNQHLWQPNSGRMLWMTQPAWPSNSWQIFNSDYDTNGSFYGVKKACESVHVQLDLSDYSVSALNTTTVPLGGVSVRATVYSLANQQLLTREGTLDLSANAATPAFSLPLATLFPNEGVVLVRLEMKDIAGKLLSNNFYWLAADDAQYRKLSTMPQAKLTTSAHLHREGSEIVVELQLTNSGTVAALEAKATLKDSLTGLRILPAYYSDNYVSLLPGESQAVTVRYSASSATHGPTIALRGWNLVESSVAVH
ncbi:MAG: glycosyl hydrolase 2 galactose-binding domain-containing protein [Janthinobacterium lividum]